ncbi:DUF2695 domain-containing protein [Glutamicibacter uratoxydans]|uniref:DUF2695 domain-containing protein n=1 Tax=Glutamicibacter uratoxydans TaxID=43667 RepID=UPI003D6DEEB6
MNELPLPVDHECLICYLYRMGGQFPCEQSLRFVKHYRDTRVPRATALERKVQMLGGYCDCEVLMNAVRPASLEAARLLDAGDDILCHGVRRGSIQPCDQWMMRRGVQWGGGQFRRRSA